MKLRYLSVAVIAVALAGCAKNEAPKQAPPPVAQRTSPSPLPKPTILVEGKVVNFNRMTIEVPTSWEIMQTPVQSRLSFIPVGSANCPSECEPLQIRPDTGNWPASPNMVCSNGQTPMNTATQFKAGGKQGFAYSACNRSQFVWVVEGEVLLLASYDVPELTQMLANATWR